MKTLVNKNLALALQDPEVRELIRKNAIAQFEKAKSEASAAQEVISSLSSLGRKPEKKAVAVPVRRNKKALGNKTDAIRDILDGEETGMTAKQIHTALMKRGFPANMTSIHASLSMMKRTKNSISVKKPPNGNGYTLYFYP